MKRLILLLAFIATACSPQKRIYKITFSNGDYDYYDLDYKLKPGATSFQYGGETILGVKEFELIK